MNAPELKSCPFCKSDVVVLLPPPRHFCNESQNREFEGNLTFYAHCDGCGCDGPVCDNEADAIEKWNTRADLTPAPGADYVAALEAALRNIRELNTAEPDAEGHRWVHSDLIDQEVLAALSARPTAPETRVVTVAQLERLASVAVELGDVVVACEINTIIGGQAKHHGGATGGGTGC
jgi:hypothetical protein